jgi:hypothetical protein
VHEEQQAKVAVEAAKANEKVAKADPEDKAKAAAKGDKALPRPRKKPRRNREGGRQSHQGHR